MKTKAIIIGAGTYGEVYSEYLSETYEIIGFFDDNESIIGSSFNDINVLGTVADAKEYIVTNENTAVFIPLGNNNVRKRFFDEFEALGAILPSFIHPTTTIHESVKLGKGVYILPNSSIMPFSVIGDFTMISMGVNIAHHTKIGKGCFFSQGTNVGASITVDDLAYCGISSTLMTGVKKIGFNSLIGAGAVVIRDVEPNTVVAGVPAKLLKKK